VSQRQIHRLPVWDTAEGSGGNVVYHIVGFALFRIDGFDLTGNPKEIWATFMGMDKDACPGNGH
jgi:hypothetical protein